MIMSSAPCRPETLLKASTCELQYCSDCEMVHLMMGSMTLRIPTEHFKELAKDLGKGLAVLQASEQGTTNFHKSSVYTLHS